MRRVADAIERLAATDVPVLISGEFGTGRELIARVLHCSSKRQDAEFIGVRAQLAPEVLAYDPRRCTAQKTLRSAHGGTLLIRDVGDVPRASQRRLAELLAGPGSRPTAGRDVRPGSRPTDGHDVRIVATSDPELALAAERGLFDRELFERICEHAICVPPLRERVEDIPLLYSGFVRQYAAEYGFGRVAVSSRVHDRLQSYPWPGNVAELKSVARRAVVRARGRIEPADLDAVLPVVAERAPLENLSFEDMIKSKLGEFLRTMDGYPLGDLYETVLHRVERPLLALVMEHTGRNQVRAAEILGLNRNTLRRKLTERGLLRKTQLASRTARKAKTKRAIIGR